MSRIEHASPFYSSALSMSLLYCAKLKNVTVYGSAEAYSWIEEQRVGAPWERLNPAV